jgi:phage gp16-like protein
MDIDQLVKYINTVPKKTEKRRKKELVDGYYKSKTAKARQSELNQCFTYGFHMSPANHEPNGSLNH